MKKVFEFTNGFKWNLQGLGLVGIPRDPSEPRYRAFLRISLIYYSLVLMAIFAFVDLYNSRNLREFIERSYLATGFLIGVLKVYGFAKKIQEIVEISDCLDQLRFNDEDEILKQANRAIERLGKKFVQAVVGFHIVFLTITLIGSSEHPLAFAHFLENGVWLLSFGFALTMSQTILQMFIFSNIEFVTYAILFMIGAHFEVIGRKLGKIGRPNNEEEVAGNVKTLKEIVVYHETVKGYNIGQGLVPF
jgi:hypothetical protein